MAFLTRVPLFSEFNCKNVKKYFEFNSKVCLGFLLLYRFFLYIKLNCVIANKLSHEDTHL